VNKKGNPFSVIKVEVMSIHTGSFSEKKKDTTGYIFQKILGVSHFQEL
jgi:hypothetical protein